MNLIFDAGNNYMRVGVPDPDGQIGIKLKNGGGTDLHLTQHLEIILNNT